MVKSFLNKQSKKHLGLEIGCGNIRPELNIIGLDNCNEFIKICKEKGIKNLVIGDCLNLPFEDWSNVLYI
tara:strand:- start:218 stop:427 length:210 start_codon:yes stop_codon:yes gene_type:complete